MLLKYFTRSFVLTFLLLVQVVAEEALFDPISVYLTWKKDPTRSMTVQWITRKDRADDLVEYQIEGKEGWMQACGEHTTMPEGHPFFIHRVELTNLEPNTGYIFRTGPKSVTFKFRTMPDHLDAPIRFIEGGDVYHDSIDLVEQANTQAAAQDPYFAIIGGDIAYAADYDEGLFPEDADRWFKFLKTWKNTMVTHQGYLIPIIPAIGNHETSGGFRQTPRQAPFFYALFPFPGLQGYNVLDFGDYMSVIILDSNHTHPIGGRQAEWLYDTLEARVKTPYKFAIYHVPAYPSVRKFSNDPSTTGALIRKHWVPIFESFLLSTAFEHHDHAYKRTHPLRDGKYHPFGVLYMGDGAWGVEKPRNPHSTRARKYLAKTASTNNFIVVTVNNAEVNYMAMDREGNIIDRYVQKKIKLPDF